MGIGLVTYATVGFEFVTDVFFSPSANVLFKFLCATGMTNGLKLIG